MSSSSQLVLSSTVNGVTTLCMNNPKKLNGWTLSMIPAYQQALARAAEDPETKAVIFTGTDPYYSAGVNLGSTVKPDHPATLHEFIRKHNEAVFNAFIRFPKPILIAVNGPAIGAVVTSATLCDGIIASERATFSTPFARLAVPPEGCSSHLFPILLGDQADRMLGAEGWQPTAAEAKEAGLINWVCPHDQLLAEAQKIAEGWVAEGKERSYRGGATQEELEAVNARESIEIADAFLDAPFLRGQLRFLWSKKKHGPAMMFAALLATRPLWSLLLPKKA